MHDSKRPARAVLTIWAAATLAGPALVPDALHAQAQTYQCTGGFGVGVPVLPPLALTSLKTVPNPVLPNGPNGALRADLADYIANLPAAIRLGKALFWDMQAGSDNETACGTCHFRAGADARTRNQLNPGPDGGWNGLGADYLVGPGEFPLASDNIAGSQGVRKSAFQGFSRSGAELTAAVDDPVFNVGGVNVRQATGKNAPSVINAVFNHRQFWDGRAQPEFNGVNPFGRRDGAARVWSLDYRGNPVQVAISIQNASLASQAVGPALSEVEMSAAGRSFPDLGKKMLSLKPLGLQNVDLADGVLGSLADKRAGKGLAATYSAMIQAAFQPRWWNTKKTVTVNGKSYTLMQANFSLFWGLSIMLYEATLVSDDSPVDQFLSFRQIDPATGALITESTRPDLLDPVVARFQPEAITRQDILDGLSLFELAVAPPPSFPATTGTSGVGCIGCHLGAETTSASIRNLTAHGLEPGGAAFKGAGFDLRMERMFMKLDWTPPGPLSPVPAGADTITFDPSTYDVTVTNIIGTENPVSIALPVATYDAGWYNIGVRPTADDPGLGGTDPFGKYLSWTQYLQQTLANPASVNVPGNGLPCAGAGNPTFPDELLNAQGFPLLSGPLTSTENADVAGSFKVPGLRNVELDGPYFHNGGLSTLMQILDFYNRAGDFENATKAPAMAPLQLTPGQAKSVVAFLLALTDDRVRLEKAPFDHPQLFVPNGDNPAGSDDMIEIPAVGAGGGAALQPFLNLSPFAH